MKILHLDKNHELLIQQLDKNDFINDKDYTSSKEKIEEIIHLYEGLVIRSRFTIDRSFIDKAKNLKFIGRIGAGLENIDVDYAAQKNIQLFSAPEGNRNAVGEHTLAMLLALFNRTIIANKEVKRGIWKREENRGFELENKTVGIIGYGNMGRSFAKKLQGFDCRVICYDILPNVGDLNSEQVSLQEFQKYADVVSLHTPLTQRTLNMVDKDFIDAFAKPFWLINTARGKSVVTKDLVKAMQAKKILGAGLDVLEYEKNSFESLFHGQKEMPQAFQYLIASENVILSPHIAGWTIESKEKLAQTMVDKILANFKSK